jgi:hypothetical protein
MNSFWIIILVIFIAITGFPVFIKAVEGYSNYTLEKTTSNFTHYPNELPNINSFPATENEPLVQGEFPLTGRKGISNLGADKIWWHYPIFELGSYEQITNNIRYSNNPDEGTCMPASMCGALYKERDNLSNIVVPLPPVNPDCGTRVGYFSTDVNLLPFRTDVQNILY